MINDVQSVSTIQLYENEINETLRQIEKDYNLLIRASQLIKQYKNNLRTRSCPWCGGQMIYIASLWDIEAPNPYYGGVPVNAVIPNYRQDWECQSCFIATSSKYAKPPTGDSAARSEGRVVERWERASTPLKGGSYPVKLFRKYDRLKGVVKDSFRQQRTWYLRTDDGSWYCFLGGGSKLLTRLPEPHSGNPGGTL